MEKIERALLRWNELEERQDNRLKTLEDKIEFIMKNDRKNTLAPYEKSLQDLWDEQNGECSGYCGNDAKCECKHTTEQIIKKWNEPTVKELGEIEKHSTCKHTPIYSGKCCKECEPTVKEIKFNPPVEVKTGVEYEVKPTVKECDSKGNIVMNSNPLVDELLEKYNKDQKIEEIIKSIYTDFDNKLYTRNDFESWLRDKLRDICK